MADSESDAALAPTRPEPTTARGGAAVLVVAIVAALAAGAVAGLIGESTLDYFKPSEAAAKNLFDPGPLRKELAVLTPRNVAIAYGTAGLLLGALLGIAGGLARKSPGAGLVAAVAGGVLGAFAGIACSLVLVPIFLASFDPARPSIGQMIMVRGGIWAAIGAGAGFALGFGHGHGTGIVRPLLAGLIGGLLGTIAFEVVNAMLNPLDRNDSIIPTSALARFAAYLVVPIFIALFAAAVARQATPPKRQDELA